SSRTPCGDRSRGGVGGREVEPRPTPGVHVQVYPDYRPPRGSRMPKTAAMVNPTVTWIRAWSGRPGQSPTRGSHGSGRARLTHPALQIMGSLHDAASLSVGVALR